MIRYAITKWFYNHRAVAIIAIALFAFIGLTFAQLGRSFIGQESTLNVGSVAVRDIRAPIKITYVSEVETNRQRDLAAAAIASIYTSPDAQIARRQIQAARDALDKISLIRSGKSLLPVTLSLDATAIPPLPIIDRIRLLTALTWPAIDENNAQYILKISDGRWVLIDSHIITLLDETMRTSIRTDNLDAVKARMPSLVSFVFSTEEANFISEFTADFIVPNTSVDNNATTQARTRARNAVRPVERTFETNQTIIRGGEIVTPIDIEALDRLNLRRAALTWMDILGALAISVLFVGSFSLGLARYHLITKGYLTFERIPMRRTFLSVLLIIVSVFLLRWQVPGRPLFSYAVPTTALSMAVTSWSGGLAGVVASLAVSILGAANSDNPQALSMFYFAGGLMAGFSIGRAERISDYVRAGVLGVFAQLIVLLVFEVPAWQASGDATILLTRLAFAVAGGFMSIALAPAILYVVGLPMQIITPLQLMDLSRPSHPLIQLMLNKAPGSYHHSLMVANLAEHAAERIGADALLTRVGAYYHDVGKLTHPYFFIENQLDGSVNPHDNLEPLASAQALHNHVSDGLKLAQKYHLPLEIQAFISEHHGTTRAGSPYGRALKANPELKSDAPFRYKGPRPRSRETAILMLADGCEAFVRARKPATPEEMTELINKIVVDRLNDHQLDNSDLTLRDIDLVRQSFAETLRGLYHPRIDYPESAPVLAPQFNPTTL